jgi:hypothetical protein
MLAGTLKNKRFWIWLLVGAALAFALLTILGLFPTRANYCSYHESGYKDCSSYYLVFIPLVWSIDHLEAVSTLVTGIATGVIALLTKRLWQISRDDLNQARLLERAYLWPGPGHTEVLQPGRRRINITVHNTGKTTGIITDVFYLLSTQAEFDVGGTRNWKHLQRENVIPPEMGGQMMFTGASVELIGKEPKILHGYIVYSDVFKKIHRCPWKHQVLPDGNSDPLEGCYSEWD